MGTIQYSYLWCNGGQITYIMPRVLANIDLESLFLCTVDSIFWDQYA